MPDQYGLVLGIDRTNGLVGAILDDGYSLWLPQGFAYAGAAPAPLSKAWFTETASGVYLCMGNVGDSRVVLHDDYTFVGTNGVANYQGDTPWVIQGSGGTRIQDATTLGNALGVVRYLTNATTNNFVAESKDSDAFAMLTPPAALWWSGRCAINTLTSHVARWGVGSTPMWNVTGANHDSVTWEYASNIGANWTIATAATSGFSRLDTGIPADADTWHDFDLVFVPGEWAAGWIDGSGPYISTTAIPTSTDALQPGLISFTLANAAKRLYCDWQHVETIPGVADPRLLDPTESRFGTGGVTQPG